MRTLSVLSLLLLACDPPAAMPDADRADADRYDGGDDGSLDAAEPPLDAPTDANAPAPVEVLVLDDDVPHAGARVAFLDPEGALVAYATTDAEGHASAVLERGGAVIVTPVAETGVLRTYAWMGVEAGDVLPIVRRGTAPEVPSVESTIRLPDFPGTTRWQIDTDCGSSSDFANPQPITLREDCVRTDLSASYFDGTNTLLATTSALDRPITLGAENDLSGLRPRAVVPATFGITHLPASTSIVRLQANVAFGTVLSRGFSELGTMGPTFSASGILPDVFGGGVVIEEARVFAEGGYLVIERHAARPTDLDFETLAMPVLTGRGYSPGSGTVTLLFAGSGPVVPDGSYLRMSAPGADRDIEWNVFFTSDSFTPPALPPEMMDAAFPEALDPAFLIYRVATPSDTADLRQRVFSLTTVSDLLTGSGDLVYTYLSSAL